eukprot:UN14724
MKERRIQRENFKGSQKIFYASYDHVQYICKIVQDHIFTLGKNHSHTAHLSDDIDKNPLHTKKRFRMTSLCTTVVIAPPQDSVM